MTNDPISTSTPREMAEDVCIKKCRAQNPWWSSSMGGRLDTWVFGVSIAIPHLCIAVLVLWHLVTGLLGKLAKKRKTFRHSPEPLHEQRIRHARELLTLSEEESCKQRFLGF